MVEAGWQEVEAGRQVVEAGRQVVEAGRQAMEAGRQAVEAGQQEVEAGQQGGSWSGWWRWGSRAKGSYLGSQGLFNHRHSSLHSNFSLNCSSDLCIHVCDRQTGL